MQITLNGDHKRLKSALSIHQLILELGIEPDQVAVEINGVIAPKSTHSATLIADGDRIELVRFIGGG